MADITDQKESCPATLQVAEEEVKLNMEGRDIDLQERDPNHMNDDVKVKFEDIFGEPEREVFSFDRIWLLSFKVFTATKLWCYRATSIVLVLPLAVCWGVIFACTAFCRIWVCVPYLRCYDIEMLCVRRMYEISLHSFVGPCFDAVGRCFSSIRIRINKGDE